MHGHKILNIPEPDLKLSNLIVEELGTSGITAQLLVNRGITTPRDAEYFLRADAKALLDPLSFSDMPKALDIINSAVRDKKKIMIFGDYDVDGITALAVLKEALVKKGALVSHYLPHRIKEGYGLNKNIANICREKHIGVLITVDCGTNSLDIISDLRKHGIEVIITDHHEPSGDSSRPASALINPKVNGSGYGFKDLAGVGVAFKLAQAVLSEGLKDEFDLVCLGTIADVAPLRGENRIFAKEGLKQLSCTRRPGLKALMEVSGLKNKKIITAGFVSYILGPRLNASGRVGNAETSLDLLLSRDEAEASALAKAVHEHNRHRQKIEEKILQEAEAIISREINFKEHRVIVLAKEDWHQGVLGIVASKLADRFYRPTILISVNENMCKGSGRSIENFHLFHALLECKELLEGFGGHSHAVGILIAKDSISDFKDKINKLAHEKLSLQDLIPALDIDMELGLSDINDKVVRELEILEPFGAGNPEPVFYTRSLRLKGEALKLGRETLKFWATDGTVTYPVIGFGMSSLKQSLEEANVFDLVYAPRIDSWQGEGSVILEVKDIFFR